MTVLVMLLDCVAMQFPFPKQTSICWWRGWILKMLCLTPYLLVMLFHLKVWIYWMSRLGTVVRHHMKAATTPSKLLLLV